ncbi:MAG: hypothetical protein GX587_09630 [Bacteroidales bacterium]|nr:hypothetical protein [Bacteroidales bacterium]
MEQLTYVPLRVRIKLSYQEMLVITRLLSGYVFSEKTLEKMAVFEWAIKKSIQYKQKCIAFQNKYVITLNAQDALMMDKVLSATQLRDPLGRAVSYKITDSIHRMV